MKRGSLYIYVPTALLSRHVIGNQAYCLFATIFGKVWLHVHTWVRTQHCGNGTTVYTHKGLCFVRINFVRTSFVRTMDFATAVTEVSWSELALIPKMAMVPTSSLM